MPPMPEPASERRPKSSSNTDGDGCGCSGAPTSTSVPSRLSSEMNGSRSCDAATVFTIRSKLRVVLRHLVGVLRDDDLVRTQALAVVDLRRRRREQHRVRAERVRELHAHVSEPAEADDADLLARARAPVLERRVERDAGAQQRRGRGRIQLRRHAQHEVLVHDDPLRIAAVGHRRGPERDRASCR